MHNTQAGRAGPVMWWGMFLLTIGAAFATRTTGLEPVGMFVAIIGVSCFLTARRAFRRQVSPTGSAVILGMSALAALVLIPVGLILR
jgi:hypothetical protein